MVDGGGVCLMNLFCPFCLIRYKMTFTNTYTKCILLIITNLLIVFTLGQIPTIGKCPEKIPLHPVDIRKFSGVWYEIERTSSLAEWPYKCITFKVQPFFEHKSNIKVSAIHRFSEQLETYSIPLWLKPTTEGKDGKIWANLSSTATNGIKPSKTIPIQILATDDESKIWGIAWSCRDFKKMHTESLWIFARKRIIDDDIWSKIREAVISLNLENYITRETGQNGCAKEDEETEDEGR